MHKPAKEISPIVLLIVVVLVSLGALAVSQFIFTLLISLITGVSITDISGAIHSTPKPLYQNILLLIQALTSATGFILVPIIVSRMYEKLNPKNLFVTNKGAFPDYLVVILLTIVLMVVNAPIIEWNMNFHFPEPFHSFAKNFEGLAERATHFLTSFYSLPYFLACVIVVAVIPAIGEELLFRGMIQRYGMKIFKNHHVAIWITAIAFSAFHFQFFGFLPRMLLGAFFGYLYFYSGNLRFPILAHFVNNGFTILMLYLYQKGHSNFDIEESQSFSLIPTLVFLFIAIFLFGFFVKRMQKDNLGE